MAADRKVHYRACNLCEAICGLEIAVEDGRVVAIRGDAADPLSRGHICPKAVALIDIQDDPDRLRKPVRRQGSDWIEIGWEEAVDLVADRLAAIRSANGDDAIATYQGNPNVHNLGLMTHSGNFLGLIKTRNRFTATSCDQLPHQFVCWLMYGHQLLIPVPDIDRTEYLLMLGANPIASNGSMMTVPDVAKRLQALRQRGGRLVVIDPRRTETAAIADEHHFIRPGSDAAFLFALVNVIRAEGLAKPGRLTAILDGLDQALDAAADFTPEAAAHVTGIDAEAIRRIAREFASSPRAVCYGRMGVSTQRYGSLCQWAIQLLNVITGNLDREGGAMLTRPAIDLVASAAARRPGSFARWRSRVRGAPEVNGEIPAAALAEEILAPGEGQVRALICVAGNPVLSTPNGVQLEKALGELEFMVAIDMYVNETTRFADVILPPTSPLEHDHFDLIFNLLAVRNVARYNAAVLAVPDGAMHDWEIMDALAAKFAQRIGVQAKPGVPPQQIIDFGLQNGAYGRQSEQQLSLRKLREVPHGVDLGALEPCLPGRLVNPDKRIHCAPPMLLAGLHASTAALLGPSQPGMLLIGRRHVRCNNSWMHNSRRLVKGKDRSAMLLHPDDMEHLGVHDGESVRVTSRSGGAEIAVESSRDMMPGVASIPHGWGHDRPGVRLRVAAQRAGVSANDLTDEQTVDALTGNAVLNGVPVTIERIAK